MKKMIQGLALACCCVLWSCVVLADKPYNELEIRQATLTQYPEIIRIPEDGVEVTIGDLHGNALKLLYFLISNDVITVSRENYRRFVAIYGKNPEKLTEKDLVLFHDMLDAASVNTRHKIRFLGDDLCDRGMNDYYTLSIYKKLDTAGVAFDIVLSNHGHFFLTALERDEPSFDYNPYGEGRHESTVRSMLNMGKLIARGLVDKRDILDTIQTQYLKHLVLPGYVLNEKKQEITIYSHAPLDLAMLAALAEDLNLPFRDSDLKSLAESFDGINRQIHQWIMAHTLTAHYRELKEKHEEQGRSSPLADVLWNRNYTILEREHHPKGKAYSVSYVHGHDSTSNVFDLDNVFGKGDRHHYGPYAVHLTHS
ncbi:Dot/Icm T4SS effector Wip [Legionella spiritensis]|uniref:WipA-like phosphatase domain-containing protein n=1 Tax=Legionella spiritensis TaxID=452 RepID=A0A0W0YW58_LEGSP|nr:Dot/Icm T4SS effector Wip [Legionella spiritensis]KTD61130.1 hypothetical protein Lspi_2750 [Legionella spiritensis]SNV45091.1 Dot/Icm secretion system substrate [Legionella spiritensis]